MASLIVAVVIWLVFRSIAKESLDDMRKGPSDLTLDCGCVCKYNNTRTTSAHTSTKRCLQHEREEQTMRRMTRGFRGYGKRKGGMA